MFGSFVWLWLVLEDISIIVSQDDTINDTGECDFPRSISISHQTSNQPPAKSNHNLKTKAGGESRVESLREAESVMWVSKNVVICFCSSGDDNHQHHETVTVIAASDLVWYGIDSNGKKRKV